MIVRFATDEDVEAITDIYNEAVRTTVATFDTEEKTIIERKMWLLQHSEKLPVWICEVDGEKIGWASLSRWSERLAYAGTVENSVYIFEKHRGRGAGKAMMKELVDFARKQKYQTVLARISDGNDASIKLHQQFGFVHIGVMKNVGWKFNRWIDVALMQLLL